MKLSLKTIRDADWRYYVGSIIIILAFLSALDTGFSLFKNVFIALATTIGTDYTYNRVVRKKSFWPRSAVVSGLLIGVILQGLWWHTVIAAVLAMLFKQTIRWKTHNIFNPAALGMVSAGIFLPISLVWSASAVPLATIALGLLLAYIIGRIPLILAYFAAHAAFMAGYSVLTGTPFIDNFMFVEFFMVFLMLVEPVTSPSERKIRLVYGVVAALLINILILTIGWFSFLPAFDPVLTGLLGANLVGRALSK
ncbi:TPA: RnfABCDGE type electron transport complex subunit D [archaeon]|nr:RnfABCDGE type electron transport complex subunit D [Candidatus Undinarchaeales archaeon SRR5007147.bin71]